MFSVEMPVWVVVQKWREATRRVESDIDCEGPVVHLEGDGQARDVHVVPRFDGGELLTQFLAG